MNNHEIITKAMELEAEHKSLKKYVVIVDFSRTADQHRFFRVDVKKGVIDYSWFTSHGKNSGDLVKATSFSNKAESKQSSLGLMKTAETYPSPKFGYALKLDGLEWGVNNRVRNRTIVIHPSAYVAGPYVRKNKYPGRSWGCITLDPDTSKEIIDSIKGGCLVYVNAK